MNIDFELILRALGLAFVLEGILWTLFPEFMRQVMTKVVTSTQQSLRNMGLFGILLGLTLVWLAAR